MGLVLVPAPATEPLTLAEAKLHLRENDTTSQDGLIADLARAARQFVENETGRSLITQQWRLTLARFPAFGECIRLGRPPLISVESLKYYDSSGALQTLSPSAYYVDTSAAFGEID